MSGSQCITMNALNNQTYTIAATISTVVPRSCVVFCKCPFKDHAHLNGEQLKRPTMVSNDTCWDKAPNVFAPAPKFNPWGWNVVAEEVVPLSFEVEVRERTLKRRALALARRQPKLKVAPVKTSPVKVVLPERECVVKADLAVIRSKILARIRAMKNRPKFVTICGVKCPPIRGNWIMYVRRTGETNSAWKKRVRGMVFAKKMGKEMVYEETWETWSLANKINWLSKRLFENGRYSALTKLNEEEVSSDFIWKKVESQPKERVEKVKQMGPAIYADLKLMQKLRLARLNEDRCELIVRQRQRRRAVVIVEKSRRCFSLKSALLTKLESFVKQHADYYNQEEDHVVGEMEDSKDQAGVNPEPKTDKKSTVVLEDKESASVASSLPTTRKDNEYLCLAVPKASTKVESYVDRWITIRRGNWTNQNFGAELFSLDLPKELLSNETFRASPNYMPFRNHVYWRGNMKVNIKINANARQHGQLQISWYPLSHMDTNYDTLRRNVFNASQRSHALVTASFSNSAIIEIPFSYFNPVFCVSRGPKDWDDKLYFDDATFGLLGTLQCLVLSPLTVAESTPLNVSYSVLIAFEDSHFSGLVDAGLVEGQMFSAASLLAVHQVASMIDGNRDNPTVSSAALPMIPINTGSWCIGNGMPEWTNVLRLNPHGVTPYEEGRSPAIDEMSISFIKRIFGLIKTIHWTAQRNSGDLLWRMDAAPCMKFGEYPPMTVVQGNKSNTAFSLPPVAVLSNLFAWWRGSLELRIDIVGAVELTGRLLVAYVPRVYKDITIDQAFNCPHSIFDLQTENRQFNFKIPFVADRLFWPRSRILQSEYSDYPSPGMVYFFVYNSLIANSTIPSDCNLIIYIAGGDDFEVSVPAFPNIGTSFFPIIEQTSAISHKLVPKAGYFPVYSGNWHSLFVYTGYGNFYPAILRYGETSDHIAQFDVFGDIIKIMGQILVNIASATTAQIQGNKNNFTGNCLETTGGVVSTVEHNLNLLSYSLNFMSFFDEYGYCYCVNFPALVRPAKIEQAKFWEDNFAKIIRASMIHYRINKSRVSNVYWRAFNLFVWKYRGEPEINLGDKVVSADGFLFENGASSQVDYFKPDLFELALPVALGEMGDQRSEAATSASAPQATACGRSIGAIKTFGESFMDLKDYCRRYQLYAKGSLGSGKQSAKNRLIMIKFPVIPQGLDLKTKLENTTDQYFNRNRDGPMSLILSGYRFFCGGIRFRIAVDYVGPDRTSSNAAAKVFVQHRPDVFGQGLSVTSRTATQVGTDDIELSGYATYYQYDRINNIISFEVPFYKPCLRTLLQRPAVTLEAMEFSTLGEIAVGFTLPTTSDAVGKFKYEIYYKFADDSRASDFIGFPPMIDLTRIVPVEIPNTLSETPISLSDMHQISDSLSSFDLVDEENDPAYAEGFSDYLPFASTVSKVNSAADKVGEVDIASLNDSIKESKTFIATLKETVANHIPTISTITNKVDSYLQQIVLVVTNLIHCLLSMNIRSVCVAIISVFTSVKLMAFKTTSKLIDILFKVFQRENPGVSEELKEATKDAVVGEMDDVDSLLSEKDLQKISNDESNYKAAISATLIAGVAASLALIPRCFNSNFKSVTMLLFEGIKKFAMTANVLFTFIKNNLIVMQRIGNSLISDEPQMKDVAFLEKQQASIYKWACDVIELTDPWKETELFTSIVKSSKVYSLFAQGSLVLLQMSKVSLTPPQLSILNKLYDNLRALRDRLAKAHIAPPVKFVPFVYELSGPTGTGKSAVLNELPYALLKSMKLKFSGQVIYDRALGNAYWNNCHNQPVCSVDEKFPVLKTGFDDVQIAELFQLKSSCIFNPPMADIPDKNLRYNPIILQYASNNAWPQLSGIMDPDAINNRRDVLVRVTICQDYIRAKNGKITTCQEMPYCDRANFKYIRFQLAKSTTKQSAGWGPKMTYAQFEEIMCKKFQNYYIEEFGKFRLRLERSLSLHPDANEEDFSTFEQQWQDMIDIPDAMIEVRDFGAKYQKIIADFEKDRDVEKRQLAIVKALRVAQKVKEEQNISDATLLERIKKQGKNVAVVDDGASTSEVEEAADATTAEGDGIQLSEKTKFLGELISVIKAGQSPCPHQILKLAQINEMSGIHYCSKTNAWRFSDMQMTGMILDIQTHASDMGLDIQKFGGELVDNFDGETEIVKDQANKVHLYSKNDQYFISQYPCDSTCWFNSEFCRKKFYNSVIQNDKILSSRLLCGNIDQLIIYLPKEYTELMKTTYEKVKVEKEEMKQEIGFIRNLYETVKEKLMSIEWRKWFSRLALLLGVFFFIGSIFKVWSYFTGESQNDKVEAIQDLGVATMGVGVATKFSSELANGQGFTSGDARQGATKKTPVSIAARVLGPARGEMNEQLVNSVKAKMRKNTFFLVMRNEQGHEIKCRAMGVCGRSAIIVDHSWEAFNNFNQHNVINSMYYIQGSTKITNAVEVKFEEFKYKKFTDSGLGLIFTPLRLGNFCDLRNFILSMPNHSNINGKGLLYEIVGDDDGVLHVNQTHSNFVAHGRLEVQGDHLYSDFTSSSVYRYASFHGKGRCGSVLLALDSASPIAGIHIAGNSNSGFSESIYREMFSHLNACPSKDSVYGEGMPMSKQDWFVDAQVRPVGTVSSKLASRAQTKTRIVPSVVQKSEYSDFPVLTDTAVLAKKDSRIPEKEQFSPMLEGVKHHGKPLRNFNTEDLRIAVEDYKNVILASCIPQRQKVGVLPVLDAIAGFEGKDMYGPLEWNSSEGFPFSSFRPPGAHDKRWMFEFDAAGRCIGYNNLLRQEMAKKWCLRNQNVIPETVFIDCLKDARIVKEKVLTPGKTRVFSISPVDFTIQQRQCTLDFTAAFMENRLNLEHAIGINPDSFEWTDLTLKLLQKGDSILTGDYSKFGDTIPPEIIHAFFDVVIAWYEHNGGITEEHKQQLKIMACEIANSTHLMFNFLYQVICGQPSGNSLTVIINSFANSIYLRLAWLHIMRNTPWCGLTDLHRFVSWFSYGDDIIASLAQCIRDLFNAQSLHIFFSMHNLNFTNANKGTEIVPYTNLVNAEFLKRSFAPHPQRGALQIVLAPLGIASIEETVNWINADYADEVAMSIQVCEDSLRNAYGRGPEYYTTLRQRLVNFWLTQRVHFIADTWEQLDVKIFDFNLPLHSYVKRTPNPPLK